MGKNKKTRREDLTCAGYLMNKGNANKTGLKPIQKGPLPKLA